MGLLPSAAVTWLTHSSVSRVACLMDGGIRGAGLLVRQKLGCAPRVLLRLQALIEGRARITGISVGKYKRNGALRTTGAAAVVNSAIARVGVKHGVAQATRDGNMMCPRRGLPGLFTLARSCHNAS